MKEYSLLVALALPLVVLLDHRLGTRIWRRRSFWIFLPLMSLGQLMVDGYLTWRPVFEYPERFICGVRIGRMPIEDLLFGIEFVTSVVVVWEFYRRRGPKSRRP